MNIADHAIRTYGFERLNRAGNASTLTIASLSAPVAVVVTEPRNGDAYAVAFRIDTSEGQTTGNIRRHVQTSDDVWHIANDATSLPIV
jgi:hypothetical protein